VRFILKIICITPFIFQKKTLTFLLFFGMTLGVFSQNKIIGFVKDAVTNKPLPFATILVNNSISVITDAEGKFEITLTNETKEVKVSYFGFESQNISLTPQTGFYNIDLRPDVQKLNEVTVVGNANSARSLIEKALAKKEANNPKKVLSSYSYKNYEKILISADLDTVNKLVRQIDSISSQERLSETDSTDAMLVRNLQKNHLYLSEKLSTFYFDQNKGEKQQISAYRMAGFKEPVYEVLAVDLQSNSWFNDRLSLLGNQYSNPYASPGLSRYNYRTVDTVLVDGRPGYVVSFSPKDYKRPGNLQGFLYIDTLTLGLQNTLIETVSASGIDIKATQKFTFIDSLNLWFLSDRELVIRQDRPEERIEILSGDVSVKAPDDEGKLKGVSKIVYFQALSQVSELKVNSPTEIKGLQADITFTEDAHRLTIEKWASIRPKPATERDLKTYRFLDSLVLDQKIESKINLGRKLLAGWYPTKYIDWDLRTLIKYNNFEGFRSGLGFITNEKFSERFRLDGYGVYGFKDEALKYSFGAAYKVRPKSNTWVGLSWVDDLQEVGNTVFLTDQRIFSLFEPRLFNIELFYDTQILSAYVEHDITANLFTKFQISKGDFFTKFDYNFINDGEAFDFFKLGTATWSFQYNPFSRFVKTHKGKLEVKQGFPKFSLQLTKSVDGLISGDFNFFKAEGRMLHEWKHLNNTKTTFLFEGGWGSGDLPVTHLYHMSPNNPNDDKLMGRFSVTGRNSFETMFFGEFFSDRFGALHLRHALNPFDITDKFRPELILISRAAIGDVSDQNKHVGINFKSLEDGFMESGFELNKIFKGFGLSLFYRYGPNRLPSFEDNLSFKFTYYFSFGL
jgi:hypothetical protein